MSAFAGRNWGVGGSDAVADVARTPSPEEVSMRQRLTAVGDTLVVLLLQIVFRVTMFLRHLNY